MRMDTTTQNPSQQPPKLAVGIDHAAHILDVCRRHVYTLIENRELASFKSGRRRLVRVSELERYISDQESKG